MTNAVPISIGYRIIAESESRLVAIDSTGTEIGGAYRPYGHDHFALYVTGTVARLTGLPLPRNAHFHGRRDAEMWLELIASLYVEAA